LQPLARATESIKDRLAMRAGLEMVCQLSLLLFGKGILLQLFQHIGVGTYVHDFPLSTMHLSAPAATVVATSQALGTPSPLSDKKASRVE
jgi:hypothetical protein